MLCGAVVILHTVALGGCISESSSDKHLGATPDPCAIRIIIVFKDDPGDHPDADLVAGGERDASLTLTYVREAGPNLFVYSLSSAAPDAGCRQALERLRRDARVRSADVDAQRRVGG